MFSAPPARGDGPGWGCGVQPPATPPPAATPARLLYATDRPEWTPVTEPADTIEPNAGLGRSAVALGLMYRLLVLHLRTIDVEF